MHCLLILDQWTSRIFVKAYPRVDTKVPIYILGSSRIQPI